ncbi:MAG: MFS transporter [Methanomassiliicoccales archaeon]
MVALGPVIGGEVSDRLGRRKVMLLAIGSRAVAFALVALVIMTDSNFLAISASVVIGWLVGSLFQPAAKAMIAGVVEPGKRLEAFGFLYSINGDMVALLALCMITITTAETTVSPSSMNLVANPSPEDSRGRYMGVFTFFTASGWAAGPFIGGLLMDGLVGLPALLWGPRACFGILGALGYTFWGRRMPRQVDRSLTGLADGNG